MLPPDDPKVEVACSGVAAAAPPPKIDFAAEPNAFPAFPPGLPNPAEPPNILEDVEDEPNAFDVGVPNALLGVAVAPNGVAAEDDGVSKAFPPNTLVDGVVAVVAAAVPPNTLVNCVVAAEVAPPPNIELGFCCWPNGDDCSAGLPNSPVDGALALVTVTFGEENGVANTDV